jgi:hypothetical protein
MPLSEDSTLNYELRAFQNPEFIQLNPLKRSKTIEFLKTLYGYPPKFTIKWESLDELNQDLFFEHNYGVLEHSIPFMDYLEDWFFNDFSVEESLGKKYSMPDYIDGYLDNLYASNFYKNKTKSIQGALATVPAFVVLNGQGEIVLNKPTAIGSPSSLSNYLNKFIYNNCGAFESFSEPKHKFGLFFFNFNDAEIYLQEIAKLDIEGTKTSGLSIHCISLEAAYKITREDHPEIDFRFVPDFSEVKNLLTTNTGQSTTIVDDEQQQLRFRRRTVNMFPYLERVGKLMSISNSFLLRNEYFKGVPIYIVQIADKPTNLGLELYYTTIGVLDHIFGRFIQSIDYSIGFGHNWIMQGSIREIKNSENLTNFVFFDKKEAVKFVRNQGRKVKRYKGSRTSNLEFLIRKPKVYIYNLEDFLESWEEKLHQNLVNIEAKSNDLFDAKNVYFIPKKTISDKIFDYRDNLKPSIIKKFKNTLNIKFRTFKQFAGLLFRAQ